MVACINQLNEEPHNLDPALNNIRVSKVCMGTEKSTLNVDWKAKGMKMVGRT